MLKDQIPYHGNGPVTDNAFYFANGLVVTDRAKKASFKYKEGKLLGEILDYIGSTYSGHYVGEDNVQALDLIAASGNERGFTIGNIIKYASRLGKKKGQERDDILKIIHYALFRLHFYDKENKVTK